MSLKREILAALAGQQEGLSENELLRLLALPKHLKRKVMADLEALVDSGQVSKNARHRYRAAAFLPAKGPSGAVEALFQLTGGGLAFAKAPGGQEYFIPERFHGWALPGDKVELRVLPPKPGPRTVRGGKAPVDGRKPGAEVVRVLERGRSQWVGRLRREAREAWCDVRLGEMEIELQVLGVPAGLPEGDYIVAGPPGLDLDGKEPDASAYLSHLGNEGTANLDTLILVAKAGLKEAFSTASVQEAEGFRPDPPEESKTGREDFRGQIVFTIDGADAKDFDDAVSLKRTSQGWELGVHIADVSHYVRPGSALDEEAYERGTSVYLPDKVLPMLPEALSNGLCSLRPDVDRLVLSAIISLDEKGRIASARFAEGIIRSVRRFTYEEVQAWLDGAGGLSEQEAPRLGPVLKEMQALAERRRDLRDQRGGLDFDFPETKVELDEQGVPLRLYRRPRLFAHQLIEEFMLAANETVARHLRESDFPVLYRIHEDPDPDRLNETLGFLGKLKLGGPKGGSAAPKDLQRLLKKAKGLPQERLIQTLILRSLRLARYSPLHTIHFGLALSDYCHFTSPIRRYPDLLVHRMLRARVLGKSTAEAKSLAGDLVITGEQCSAQERKAEACERDCIRAKQVRYLEKRLGEVYPATVSSVTHFGFFCEIDPFPAEGLVPLGALSDDFYDHDPSNYCLVGSRHKRRISIGDKLWVKVKRTDWETLKVDFEPFWTDPGLKGPETKAKID